MSQGLRLHTRIKSIRRVSGRIAIALVALSCLTLLVAETRADSSTYLDRSVIKQAWNIVRQRFFDPKMQGLDWPAVLVKYQKLGENAQTQDEVHSIVLGMLGELKVSHLSLFEPDVYKQHVVAEFENRKLPCFGMSLVDLDAGLFVSEVLVGSEAERRGVRRGDRILSLNNQAPNTSGLLLPAGSDPGLEGPNGYYLKTDQTIQFKFERKPNVGPKGVYTLTMKPKPWNAVAASEASAKIVTRYGHKMGYIHLYHLASLDVVITLEKALVGKFNSCDGIVLDLRGRGGTPENVDRVLAAFERFRPYGIRWTKPIVAITDSGTRSAKEVLAFHLRRRNLATLVGERTQGAVLGGKFFRLKDGSWLIVPAVDMRALTMGVSLEGNGVKPHIDVADQLPYANGEDRLKSRAFEELFWQIRAKAHKGKARGFY